MFEQSLVPHLHLASMCPGSTPRVLIGASLLSLKDRAQAMESQKFLGRTNHPDKGFSSFPSYSEPKHAKDWVNLGSLLEDFCLLCC